MEMVFITPTTKKSDLIKCSESIRDKKILYINLEEMEQTEARRLMNYVCGAVFMTNGKVYNPSDKVFCAIPENVVITKYENSDEEPEIKTNGD